MIDFSNFKTHFNESSNTFLIEILKSKFDVKLINDGFTDFIVKKDNLILYFKEAKELYRFYKELIIRADNINILNFFLIVSRNLSFYDSHLIRYTYYKFLDKSEIEYLGSFNWSTFEIITPSPQNDMKLIFGYKKYNINFKFLILDNDNKLRKIKLFERVLRNMIYEDFNESNIPQKIYSHSIKNSQKSYNNILFFDYDIENASTRVLFNEKIYKLPHISQKDEQSLTRLVQMYDRPDKIEKILNFLSRENLSKLRSSFPISSLIISDIIELFLMLQVEDCLDELFKYKNYIKYTSTAMDIHLYLDFNGFEIHLPNLKNYQSYIIAISELKDLDQELIKIKTITDLEGLQ